MRWDDVPKFLHGGDYGVDLPHDCVEGWIDSKNHSWGIDLDPDFQRGHVWNDEQRRLYVEYISRGGTAQRTLYWNSPSFRGPAAKHADLDCRLILVDGKRIRDLLEVEH